MREEFRSPDAPLFRPRHDGSYNYELTVIPTVDPDLRQRIREVRETGDPKLSAELSESGLLPEPVPVQSGHFRVRNGSIVLPGEAEKQ